MLLIQVITLFPDMFVGPLTTSIVKRAQEKLAVAIEYIQLRDFASDAYKTVDDAPYGGGAGMILKVDIIDRALSHAKNRSISYFEGKPYKEAIILLDPQGTQYTQSLAQSLATGHQSLILICGHYEGVDERVRDLVDYEISIGDYILTGGEIPTMVLIDSIVRLVPGVLKDPLATSRETFGQSVDGRLLETPQYTRPDTYKGMDVPQALLSGNHKTIEAWRRDQSRVKTKKRRPDLLKK